MTEHQKNPADTQESTMRRLDADIDRIEKRIDSAIQHLDAAAAMLHTVIDKLIEAETPGYWAEFSDEEAALAGAFDEDAITGESAYDASFDNPDVE